MAVYLSFSDPHFIIFLITRERGKNVSDENDKLEECDEDIALDIHKYALLYLYQTLDSIVQFNFPTYSWFNNH
jgi:hypothetical protein